MAATPKESAKFIFQGKVIKTKAGNVKAVASKGQTIVVAIEHVVSAPEPLLAFSGRNVTVGLAPGEQVKQGQRAIFYTNGWVFGENLAVQSLGHEPVESATRTAKGSALRASATPVGRAIEHDAALAAAHVKIRQRASEAPVVISGKVVAVGLPAPKGAPGAAAAASGPSEPERISEHEPFWREAVVEVKQIHKGTLGKNQVVLRFPSSTDVRWYHSPKFEPGQEGVFSLRPDAVSGHVDPGVMAASLSAADSYTCLNAADFQPSRNAAETAVAIDAAKK
jgi:hypothetical protein